MDEPIVKNYSFTQGVGKDGIQKYFIDGSEIRDKTTWERLKNKAGQVMNESFEDVNNSQPLSFIAFNIFPAATVLCSFPLAAPVDFATTSVATHHFHDKLLRRLSRAAVTAIIN